MLGLYYLLMVKVYRNDNNACLQYAREAYGILSKTNDKKNKAAALVYIANCYQATGFVTRSMESNLAALLIYESVGNDHGEGVCYTNIGVACYDLHQYDYGGILKPSGTVVMCRYMPGPAMIGKWYRF